MTALMNISITGLTPSQFSACPKPDPGLSTSYGVVFFDEVQ